MLHSVGPSTRVRGDVKYFNTHARASSAVCQPDVRHTVTHATNAGEQSTYTDEEVEAVLGLPPDHIWPYTGPSIESLQDQYNQIPYITVHEGPHGHPVVWMVHPNGSDLQLHLHGAFISSWVDQDDELLFLHPGTDFDPSKPLNGGALQAAFPQYNFGLPGMPQTGNMTQHGFLASQHFDILATTTMGPLDEFGNFNLEPEPMVSLCTSSNPSTLSVFPHEFALAYHVTLMRDDTDPATKLNQSTSDPDEGKTAAREKLSGRRGGASRSSQSKSAIVEDFLREYEGTDPEESTNKKGSKKSSQTPQVEEPYLKPQDNPSQIRFNWEVTNTGDTAFEFQAASFADLAVKDLRMYAQSVRLVGLKGRYVLDKSEKGAVTPDLLKDDTDFMYPLTPPGTKMDRVYCSTQNSDVLFCPGNLSHYELVCRDGFKDTIVAHPDLEAVEWNSQFVTIGAGKIAAPVKLEPGQQWCAEFVLRKHRKYWNMPDFEKDGTPLPEDRETHVELDYGR